MRTRAYPFLQLKEEETNKQYAPTSPYVERKVFFAYFLFQKKVGQANKSTRGMPWHQEPKKDVTSCDKLWGAAHRH